jgi:hypothetical protein
MMDQKKLIKAALGRIKKLAMSSSAGRLKKKLEAKKAPPAESKPAKAKEPEPDKPELELDTSEEVEPEPEPAPKKTTELLFAGRRKAPPAPPPAPEKKKPGRPKKVKA